ncbi:MAG: TRAP transporter substrate-binding protein DctP [Polyangiaceae bacterium]|nr:TRAP transporter substrate-binding protein DctP [Polyangiaceae bacterium]
MRPSFAFAALALMLAMLTPKRALAEEKLTLGTVAPKQSLWGRVFGVWEEAIKKKTDGKLELKVYYNGTQGDDGTMIGKLKAGQLDGAAVSSIGLAQIHKPILALQIPGLFRSWEALDKGRNAVKDEFEKAAEKEGFIITWGDLGKMRGMSKGFAVRKPSDLKGKKVLSWRNDVIGPTVYQVIPGVSIVALGPTEVLPTLRTGGLDVVTAPTLAAEQLQWTPHFDHISNESTLMAIGGMAWSKKRIDSLPGDLRTVLQDTGKIAQEALKKKVRAEDDEAFERLKKKMTVVELSADEQKAWRDVFIKVGERLKQGTFDPKLVDKLVAAAK